MLVLTAVLNLNTLFWSQLLEEGGFSQMKVTAICSPMLLVSGSQSDRK